MVRTIGMTVTMGLACAACGPRPAPEPPAPEVAAPVCPPPAEAWSSAACVITAEGVRLPNLTVAPEGAEPFAVDVENASADVLPAASAECVPVRVRGTLDFDATSASIALRTTATVEVEGGMVTATERTRLTAPEADGDGVSVVAWTTDDLSLSRVSMPCGALTIDVPFRFIWTDPTTVPNTPAWIPRALPVEIREGPGEGRAIGIQAAGAEMLPFVRDEERDGFSHVDLSWNDGARLRGWIRTADLIETTASAFGGDPGGGEPGCNAHGGCSGAGIYCGPADVAEGAPVYASEGAGRWAIVRDGRGAEIVLVTGAEYAHLRRLPGVADSEACGEMHHAFVPAASVTPIRETGETR